MELVEGDDPSQRIARLRAPAAAARQAGMPFDEVLPIAKQIAEALEAAHEQGIIHRDLKPANIKVRNDGTVKVLDFGLAKALDPSAASATADNAATITSPAQMTGVGVILGTAAYMAPEQAKGRPVDRRADIWAFGVVLYEMLTGQRLFRAETIPETLAQVLTREIDLGAVPAATPRHIRTLVARCLVKDPRQRLRDIGEARLAPEGAFETVASQTTATASASRGRVWMGAFAVAVLGMAALAIPALRYLLQTPPPPPPETRLEINTPATDQPGSFALSPDGRQIVFVASGGGASRLWLRSLATTTAQPLAGTDGATWPFWSPDGRSVGFFAGGALKRLDLAGGASHTLAPVTGRLGATWNAEGVIVFAPSVTGPLMRVSATGGTVTAVTTLAPQQSGHLMPLFLPDGRRVLFTASGAQDAAGIYLGSLDGSALTRLTPDRSQAVYLPAEPGTGSGGHGWLLWGRASTLVAQRLDLDRQTLEGDPVTLSDGIASMSIASSSGAAYGWSVAAPGLVAYRTGASSRRQLTWVDRSGTAPGTIGAPDDTSLLGPRVSPDGRRVAVARTVQGNEDLWLLDGARISRVTFDGAVDRAPLWSPDGTRVVFLSLRTGVGDLYQTLANGAGGEERLVASEQLLVPTSWSPDGPLCCI